VEAASIRGSSGGRCAAAGFSSRAIDQSCLALSEAFVEMLDHALDLNADLRARSRPQTVDGVDALNDHVLLPDTLNAFGRRHFNDRMEAERLAEEVARLVGRFAVALWASHPDLGLQVTLTCLFALKKFVRRAPVMTSSHKGTLSMD
jgi:hypothetical protein